ncbi:universal stress protein [Haladaptatus sp. CMAA 1911]|uniref:universal stress protein n=1 Tax=unclassified Haladaptatus TaxID=2622732 RepID=UPI00375520F9
MYSVVLPACTSVRLLGLHGDTDSVYDQILVPTDGSDGANVMFDHILDIAAEHDVTVHILNIADTTHASDSLFQGAIVDALDLVDIFEERGEEIVRVAAERAHRRGVDTVTDVVRGEPSSSIVDYASSQGIDLITMPTHGRDGLTRFLIRSTAERVVRQADTPVLTIRPGESTTTYPYRDVLVPTDGSDCATEALSIGIEAATTAEASLHLLSVDNTASLGIDIWNDSRSTSEEEDAHEVLETASTDAKKAGVGSISRTVEHGPSNYQSILSYVDDHDIDLVIAGTRDRTGFNRSVFGSVTDKLVRRSPVPCLTL